MTPSEYNQLEASVLTEKQNLDESLKELLSQAPNITQETLNQTCLAGTNFFSKFESFIMSCSSEFSSLSKAQTSDILTSIENILIFSIDYWSIISKSSLKVSQVALHPPNNFLRTSQSVFRTYNKTRAEEIRKEFQANKIPVSGFTSKDKYKLTSQKIDWTSLIIGIVILVVSGFIVFKIDINTGMQYFFSRIIISLGVALVFTGITKNKIQTKINMPGFAITAIGTIAIFLILYFLNPADIPTI